MITSVASSSALAGGPAFALTVEIGHLLGLDAHSDLGIMRAAWSPTYFMDLSYGDLAFTPEQAAVIRSEVNRRVK